VGCGAVASRPGLVRNPPGDRSGAGALGSERFLETTVSSEEVARGKPAPDVYLEAARQLRVHLALCAAVEDSSSGILSAHAAGMCVVAIPNSTFPPSEYAPKAADAAIPSLQELYQEVIDSGA
jgi:beta-phosphoglucomutase-like phosphatase (HAD superfamily)